MPECPICIERKRTIACCPLCEVRGCRDCMLRMALENPLIPRCVGNCRGLSMGDLQITIGPGLISKQFRPALRLALLEHEKTQIPNTMAAVDAVKRQEAARAELAVLNARYDDLERLVSDLRMQQRVLEDQIRTTRRIAEANSIQDVKTVLRCQKPDCRGFGDHTGTCLVCGTHHCNDCGVLKPEDPDIPHVCDPDEVASRKEIARSAKPCPSCGAPTTRIHGCPQMWCTYCRTGYRYDTLTISIGAVSNPHRDAFLSGKQGSVPREPGDIPCGGFGQLDWTSRRSANEIMPKIEAAACQYVPDYVEMSEKCNELVAQHWWRRGWRWPGIRELAGEITRGSGVLRARIASGNTKLTEMRVQFILKRVTDEQYSAALVRVDTRRRRDAELTPVFLMYEEALRDLDRRWLEFMNQAPQITNDLKVDEGHTKAILHAQTAAGFYRETLWLQERVQDGLNAGAHALGIKRLGRLGTDGRIRLN